MKRGMRKNFGSNVHYEDYYEYNRAPAIAAKRFRPSYWDESVEDEREGPFYPHEFSPANFSHSFFAEHKHEASFGHFFDEGVRARAGQTMMVREKGKMHGKNFFPAQPSFEAGFYKVPQQSQPSNPSISFAPSTGFDPTDGASKKQRPVNIPIGRTYTKKELEELEKRHFGPNLRELLGAPVDAEVWVETRTFEAKGDESRKYFFNAITGDTTYNRPVNPNKEGGPVHIVRQEELSRVIVKTVPTTMMIKRAARTVMREGLIRLHFQQFGKVAMVKVIKHKKDARHGGPKRMGYVRMATLEGQQKALSYKSDSREKKDFTLQICQNRMFVARLPDGCDLSELLNFMLERSCEIYAAANAVDAYLCTPFPQFCVVTLRGEHGIATKLACKGDLLYKSRYFLNCCAVAIEMTDMASEVYKRKLEEFCTHKCRKIRQKATALMGIGETVKMVLSWISEPIESKGEGKPEPEKRWTLRLIVDRLNIAFSRCSAEEIRSFLTSMELILEICLDLANKLDILIDPEEFHSFVAVQQDEMEEIGFSMDSGPEDGEITEGGVIERAIEETPPSGNVQPSDENVVVQVQNKIEEQTK